MNELNYISLEVKNKQSVEESLKAQLEGELIEDFRCEACEKKVNLKKRSLLGRMPNVLILHLNRIEFDFNSFSNKKLANRYEFP